MTVLYGVVRSDRPPRLPADGLPGAGAPRALPVPGGLTAIVATVPDEEYGPDAVDARLRDMDWVSRAALGHERVLESLLDDTAAVLPMKLLTLFSSDARVVADLARRRARLAKAAARVEGCREYGLRVTPAAEPAPDASGERPSSGLAFLERKKQVRDASRDRAARQAAFAVDTWDALAGAARDAVERPVGDADDRPLLDAAFLVGVEERAAFGAASERLRAAAADAGCVITLTGPWPPYHFVQA